MLSQTRLPDLFQLRKTKSLSTCIISTIKAACFPFLLVIGFAGTASAQGLTVYPPDASELDKLKPLVEPLMRMPLEEVIKLVPTRSGFYFIGCPNCNGGAEEANVLQWKPDMGDKLRCRFCQMIFPNEKFPNNREIVIIAPSGARQVYPYYENAEGRQYFFEANAWYERWLWINRMSEHLAKLWYITKDFAYGDRAAAIAGRFAQLFPDYAVRYDYPNRPKRFFPATQKFPYEGLSDYRGAKWSWWAYMDIPAYQAIVYDNLKSGYDWKRMDSLIGQETEKRIATDLLRLGYEFATAHPEDYSNMAPGKYRDMIRVGRVLKDPAMVHEAVKRFRELLSRGFFADGWWKEGATSYHDQTVNGLRTVNEVLKGYTDPPDWKGERFENLDLIVDAPLYEKALRVTNEAILPNGHALPINDTWATDRRRGTLPDRAISRLWSSMGNAALGSGEGDNQIMLNLNWSGNYGHSHADNASIILYAQGQELFPDLGYTHTKYKSWALTTASHNTVVIDHQPQDKGSASNPVTGNLKLYDDKHPRVKVIDLDASPAYDVAKTYRRRLVMVNAAPGQDYVIDRFDVEGGKDHDWFLHGVAEQEGTLQTSIPLDQNSASLVPSWGGKELPKNQYEVDPAKYHPYLFLRDLKTGPAPEKSWTATWKYEGDAGLRTHHISTAGMQVFRFRSPAIRPAQEDDNKLDHSMQSGIMVRNSGKASTFLAVHEPFRKEPWIESIQKDGDALVVHYKLNGKAIEDRISIKENQITVNSSAGWNYNSGNAQSGKVEGLQTAGGKYRLQLDNDAPKVDYVRLDLSDGVTRYYPVSSVEGKVLELPDDPGFTMAEDGKVVFHTFPKDQYSAPLRYTLFAK